VLDNDETVESMEELRPMMKGKSAVRVDAAVGEVGDESAVDFADGDCMVVTMGT
jgi:hypothetical protein